MSLDPTLLQAGDLYIQTGGFSYCYDFEKKPGQGLSSRPNHLHYAMKDFPSIIMMFTGNTIFHSSQQMRFYHFLRNNELIWTPAEIYIKTKTLVKVT